MNVVIYARYSSDKQTDQSIEGQLKVCYQFAENNGYNVIGEYIDKALSGKNDNRPDFQRMIEDSNKKQFKGILVYQLDRFARNRYDSAIYKNKLKKNNVRVLSARENITDDASGILVEGLLESMAEYTSVELSQKVQRGMNINAEKCLSNGGSTPLGFKVVDKKLQVDPETAPIVKKIFDMYASGYRVIDITNHLNSLQYKSSRGADFNSSSLNTLLRNKKYIGVYKYADIEIPDGVPRIISDDLFYKVAEILDKNKKAPARARAKIEYLLTTKLFCGHCKSLMVGISGTSSTGKTHSYYSCNNSRKKTCDKKNVQKDYIEHIVVEECRKQLTDKNINKIAKETVALLKNDNANFILKKLEKSLKENDTAIQNLVKAMDFGENIDIINQRITQKRIERADLEKEIAKEKLKQVHLTIPDIVFFLTQLKNGDINDIKYRRSLITILVNAIYLYDDKRRLTIVFNTSDTPVTIDNILLDEIEKENIEAERSYMNDNGSP